ncbi:MAG: hypothetical protein ACPHHT_05575, partial [Ilumatobacteraceae bacterium]
MRWSPSGRVAARVPAAVAWVSVVVPGVVAVAVAWVSVVVPGVVALVVAVTGVPVVVPRVVVA